MDIDTKSTVLVKSEEELKCHICNIEFNANDLETHFANVHTEKDEEKNSNLKNTCKICQKSYKFRKNLEKHLNNVHKGNSDILCCKLCDKVFAQKSRLTLHIFRSHDKTKNHICDKCNKCFLFKHLLDVHVKNIGNMQPALSWEFGIFPFTSHL